MKNWLGAITLIFTAQLLVAQYCTPVGNCSRRDYIDNFSFNTISNMGSGGSNCGSFQNPGISYTNTGQSTNVTQGNDYIINVKGRNNGAAQGFGVWIDFNHDQDFNDIGEFVSSTLQPTNSTFTDTITIPYFALTGPTRMRVRSLNSSVLNSTQSCDTLNRGETEDYTVNIAVAPIAPLTDFKSNVTTSCQGVIEFSDLTPNLVTSWVWEFGDGDTSHMQNPIHTYTTSGTYTIKLTATNSFGSKSETKTNLITINTGNTPANAQCTPVTSSTAAGFGITSFSFATLSQISEDATKGYEDLSCNQTQVTQGNIYRMRFGSVTAPANQNFRAWIDYNNDGNFSNQELVLSQDNTTEADDMITIPSSSRVNKLLRIRIAAVYYLNSPIGSNFTGCSSLQYGQMEDYSVTISANTSIPVAKFEALPTKSCDGVVQFNDKSENLPNAWEWDFGDGNTSVTQNPLHTYTTSGSFTVKLKVTNSFGLDSIATTSAVTVDLASKVTKSCVVKTTSHTDDYGIHYVLFNTINNITTDGSEGYQDYSCTHQTIVNENTDYIMEVKTGTLNKEDVKVWIDYNNDGVFDVTSELVYNSVINNLHNDTITISSVSSKYQPLRMRVGSDISGTNFGPCDDLTYGQFEDYAIIIHGDTTSNPKPVAAFTSDSTQSCTGVIKFTDQSTNTPTSWDWDFGDGNTSKLKDPTHTYANSGKYSVTLKASNGFGNDSEIKTNFIDVDELYCNKTIGVQDYLSNSLKIYPNPSNGTIYIDFTNADVKKYQLRLLSLQGQVISLKELNLENGPISEVNLGGMYKGVYFIELKNSDFQITKKVTFN
ncbi:MAG: PKD domain-containing protein [Salibacteraceae bacterium]